MTVITVDGLSLSFGVKVLLNNISFSLDESDRLGIVGVNGCGKSTLFKLITGEMTPDCGNVYFSKERSLGILRQDDAFSELLSGDEEATAAEAMYRAFPRLLFLEERIAELEPLLASADKAVLSEYSRIHEEFISKGGLEFRARCTSTLQKLGFDAEMQKRHISEFSGGQRTRLALARELCREPDILMLDEPTNHLDTDTLVQLENHLSSYKKCLIVISHDRYFLDRVTNKTLYVENQQAKLYNGGYTVSSKKREADREVEERHYKNQQKEIARQEAYIAQQRAWNRERNIIAAESRLKLLDKMERIEKPKDAPKGIKMGFSNSGASGNEVLNVRDLSFSYPMTDAPVIKGLNFTVRKGDKLFIAGPNGCGKSTLIKILLGKLSPSSGYAEFGYNVNVGYYDQENQNLDPDNTVLDELWNSYRTRTELEMRNTLARFRFIGDDVYKKVGELSGGERARLTLSKLILSDTNLLLLDEPTNHLDIQSREELERALEEYEGTVVIVSHDRYFIDKLATRFIDMTQKGSAEGFYDISVTVKGEGYAELCRERERRAAKSDSSEQTVASSGKEQYLRSKREAADKRNSEKRLERLRAEAEKLEAQIDTLDEEINGSASGDYTRLMELDAEKSRLEERLLEIYGEI